MESAEPNEPVAVFMPLGDGKSDAYRLVFAEFVGGQVYRLLETQPEDEAWLFAGATTVFAVEGERPGRLVVVAPYVSADPPPAERKPDRKLAAAALRCALALSFTAATASILAGWCFVRPPLPVYPADPLRLGFLVSGAVVLWWGRTLETVRFSRGALALLSIPAVLFLASLSIGAIAW